MFTYRFTVLYPPKIILHGISVFRTKKLTYVWTQTLFWWKYRKILIQPNNVNSMLNTARTDRRKAILFREFSARIKFLVRGAPNVPRNGHFHCRTILINFEKSWWWPIKAISHGHISNRHSGSKKVLMATILKHLSTCPFCQHFVNIFQIISGSIVYLFLQIYRGDDL